MSTIANESFSSALTLPIDSPVNESFSSALTLPIDSPANESFSSIATFVVEDVNSSRLEFTTTAAFNLSSTYPVASGLDLNVTAQVNKTVTLSEPEGIDFSVLAQLNITKLLTAGNTLELDSTSSEVSTKSISAQSDMDFDGVSVKNVTAFPITASQIDFDNDVISEIKKLISIPDLAASFDLSVTSQINIVKLLAAETTIEFDNDGEVTARGIQVVSENTIDLSVITTNTPPTEVNASSAIELSNPVASVVGQYHPVTAQTDIDLLSRYPNTKMADSSNGFNLRDRIFDPVKIKAKSANKSTLIRVKNISSQLLRIGQTNGQSITLGPNKFIVVPQSSISSSQLNRLIKLKFIEVIGSNIRNL
tara:strand:- start:4231 stop:5322 length:1092 start_codon:yes stop_codon:yes gene_type:complete